MKIPWKEVNEGSSVSEGKYQERFWWRRLDGLGLGLDTVNKEFLAIEFKRARCEKQLRGESDSNCSGAVYELASRGATFEERGCVLAERVAEMLCLQNSRTEFPVAVREIRICRDPGQVHPRSLLPTRPSSR